MPKIELKKTDGSVFLRREFTVKQDVNTNEIEHIDMCREELGYNVLIDNTNYGNGDTAQKQLLTLVKKYC